MRPRPRFMNPVYFSLAMVQHVENRTTAGYASNKDIAASLAPRFDDRITGADVARWRRLHPRFNQACVQALEASN